MGNKLMRGLLRGVLAGAGVVLAAALVPAGAATGAVIPGSAQGGTWGNAQQIPGLAALSNGGSADLRAVSCGATGDCSAAGGYTTAAGQQQAFVADQVNGTWGTAQKVRGLAALNKGGNAEFFALSCISAGNCAAGGYYIDAAGKRQAFVVSQVNGVWGTAREIPGSAALNTAGNATVLSVSCATAGNCAAGGYYHVRARVQEVFVVSQVNGVWGSAEAVPGVAAANVSGFAEINSVSCGAPGNCSAGGSYLGSSGYHAFVTNEVNGTWGAAQDVPGTLALSGGQFSSVDSLSCTAADTCTGGGDAGGNPFVANETNGSWGAAEVVPGVAAINKGRPAEVDNVACTSPGNCSASGSYTYGKNSSTSVFVDSQTGGTWGAAKVVPGFAALNSAGNALSEGLSCGAPGDCATVGFYQHGSVLHAFTADQVAGTWGTAQQVPGIAALTHGLADLQSVACAAAGSCSAGGNYNLNTSHQQAFVVTETAAHA